MTQHEAQLNGFLVNVFNDILRLEEASIRKGAMQKPLCFRDACAGSRGKVVCRRIRRSGHGGGCRTSFHYLRHAECGCQNAGAERISRPLPRQPGQAPRDGGADICRAVRAGKPRGIPRNTGRPCSCPPERGRNSGALHRARLPARFFCRIVTAAAPARRAIFRAGAPSRCGPGGDARPIEEQEKIL